MYNIRKYRIITIILFISVIITLLLLSIHLYNTSLREKQLSNNSIIIICIVLILTISILKFIISYKLSDKSKIEQKINEKVENEKAKIRAEYEKKKEKEEKVIETEVNVDEAVKKLIPNLQNLNTLKSYTEKVLSNIAKEFEIVQGIFYTRTKKSNQYSIAGLYAFTSESRPKDFKLGETLPGQAAKSKDLLIVSQIPEKYYSVESGLGKSTPKNIVMVPVINKNTVVAVMELGTFKDLSTTEQKVLKVLASKLGDKINKLIK